MARKKSYITVTDQFCGAGGSSIGATQAGAEVRLAMNHWKLAIETHNTNFPNVDHDCTDISAVDPRRYPSTDILITSPECTNHSLAKGKPRQSQWRWSVSVCGSHLFISRRKNRNLHLFTGVMWHGCGGWEKRLGVSHNMHYATDQAWWGVFLAVSLGNRGCIICRIR